MSSVIQFIKMLVSGNKIQGIKFRTRLSILITVIVLAVEICVFYTNWDSIPDMIKYDYDFSGVANDIFAKKWIWYNLLFQMFICGFVFIAKHFLYKTKRIHNLVCDKNNKIIPIIDKRFSMFAWETAMLFVTTEQGYIFALIDIVKDRMCDDIVTLVFLFWQILLVFELLSDLKTLKKQA
ncbi:MAG: hypothetical protein IJV03_02095 [Alphaproteobacteria bacterium]|nr:hypothetical protein [Alphaproteobacteria bacterium]